MPCLCRGDGGYTPIFGGCQSFSLTYLGLMVAALGGVAYTICMQHQVTLACILYAAPSHLLCLRRGDGGYTPIFGACQPFSLTYLGLMVGGVAAVCWEASERLCPLPGMHWIRLLRLHAVWHVAMSYSVFLLLLVSIEKGHDDDDDDDDDDDESTYPDCPSLLWMHSFCMQHQVT
jgi:hypothetical protein